MSNSKPEAKFLVSPASAVPLPQLPRPVIASNATHEGTKITLFFLAIENFANRYQPLPFVTDALSELKRRLLEISKQDTTLYHQIRQFIVGMPLDIISSSAHPKRLKQLILESHLNPDILCYQLTQTENQAKMSSTSTELTRDIQYYVKLQELCADPIKSREILSQIMQNALLISSRDRQSIRPLIEKIPFILPTDRTFILKQLQSSGVIALRADQIIAPKSRPTLPSRPKDYALESILLFKRLRTHSSEIVARAGETLESIQARAQAQQKEYEQLIADCKLIAPEDREKMHQFASTKWQRYASKNPRQLKELSDFLNILANSR